jgi:imidazolonepropionase-like amidohydrolase
MVEGGLTPLEGIRAATAGSAQALGLEDVGTIDPGKIADLLIVDGDPLDDPRILLDPTNVWMVIQAGRAVAGTNSC